MSKDASWVWVVEVRDGMVVVTFPDPVDAEAVLAKVFEEWPEAVVTGGPTPIMEWLETNG